MAEIARGLEGIYVTETKLCRIDGQKGELVYSGYDIYELSEKSTFEETCFLLWNGRLPTKQEYSSLMEHLRRERPLSPLNHTLLREMVGLVRPMRALEIGVTVVGALDRDSSDLSPEALQEQATRLSARMATIITAFHRLREGKEPVGPRDDLGHAANFLWMLKGTEPTELEVKVFNVALILHAEHEMNASTFAAIVTASTQSDMYSAIASAIGTLKGPLHGGANDAVFKTLQAVGSEENIPAYVEELLSRGERLMGIGHRIYKTTDPRAIILERLGEQLAETSPDAKYFHLSRKLRDHLAKRLEGRPLYPNVDFFSASVYKMLGIPNDLYTPIFAAARIAGWTAHLMEQYANNRLVRPNALYEGAENRPYVAIAERD